MAQINPNNYLKLNNKKYFADEIKNKNKKTTKASCVTIDSFSPNRNMKDRMSKAVDDDFELFTKHSMCVIHR